ncbi:MAG TPA: hypothetical protein VLM85_16600 [Polyangiaceae bacterium]|nr:hypothetical protein [Polyangiaceae bacterium]
MADKIRSRAVLAISLGVVGCGVTDPKTDKPLGSTTWPLVPGINLVPDNPTCATYGLGSSEFAISPLQTGEHTYSLDGSNSVTVRVDGELVAFDWSSAIGIKAVIAKGGGKGANVYLYDPEAKSGTGLHAPVSPVSGYAQLSNVSFCFAYGLDVSTTAEAAFKRTYSWSIEKSATTKQLNLMPGQSYPMPYDVVASTSGWTDAAWAVSGTITIKNPAPAMAEAAPVATITGLTDLLGGNPVSVNCGVFFPYALVPHATLTCSYSSALAAASSGTNDVTVTTTGEVGGGSASASFDFSSATMTEIDKCVDVSDDKKGSLGMVCVGDAPKDFDYQMTIGPYAACGPQTFTNTGSFATHDTGTSSSGTWTVTSDVRCGDGCSLTWGYWKEHSSYGPAPYDDAWSLLPNGADTTFFLSGKSYIEVLWTAPSGNAYYSLAHQYIGAQLNGLDGASFSAVQAAFPQTTSLLLATTPDQVAADSTLTQQFIALASTLESYNSGKIGPGHCSE